MSVPTYTYLREFLEGVAELRTITRPGGVERMYDVLTAVVDFSERRHAHELAEKIRAEFEDAFEASQEVLSGTDAMLAADFIDPEVTP